MAYNNGFNGDHKSLEHILQTLDAKQILIPGVTVNAETSVTVDGESAFLYTRSATTVAAGNLGDAVTYAAKGVKRIDVPMVSRYAIGAVIPHANFSTVSADVVADKVIQEAMEAANAYNLAGITAMTSAATAKTYTKGLDAYEALVEGVKNFKVDNKNRALRPTAAIVSPAFYGKLLVDERFVHATAQGDFVLSEGLVGKAAGVHVVEAVDLTGVDFILLNAIGVSAPMNVRTLIITDATAAGYPGGTLIAGEIGYGMKVITKADDLTLDQTNGYLVAKYTQAA